MNYYANDEQRVRLIAGLLDLADFLDQNPDVSVPRRADLLVFPPEASDAEMFAEIDTIAELIGSTQATPTARAVITARFATSGRCSTARSPFPTTPATRGANSDDGLPHSRFSRFHWRRVRSSSARRHRRHTPRRSR
jgi:hypothetical protein